MTSIGDKRKRTAEAPTSLLNTAMLGLLKSINDAAGQAGSGSTFGETISVLDAISTVDRHQIVSTIKRLITQYGAPAMERWLRQQTYDRWQTAPHDALDNRTGRVLLLLSSPAELPPLVPGDDKNG